MPISKMIKFFLDHARLMLFFFGLFLLAFLRVALMLPPYRGPPKARNRGVDKVHMLIVLGSGGHTAEMLALLRELDTRVTNHRTWVITEGDSLSGLKAQKREQDLFLLARRRVIQYQNTPGAQQIILDGLETSQTQWNRRIDVEYGSYSMVTMPRARRVHQWLLTTPFTCLLSLVCGLYVLTKQPNLPPGVPTSPDLIVANGPATSAVMAMASLLLRFIDLVGNASARTRIIFVESWARVDSISLSGHFFLLVADRFLVQWPNLIRLTRGRGEYVGSLVA